MCKGASKQSPDLKIYTAPGQRPPGLKFLDPPLRTKPPKNELNKLTKQNQAEYSVKILKASPPPPPKKNPIINVSCIS